MKWPNGENFVLEGFLGHQSDCLSTSGDLEWTSFPKFSAWQL